MKRIFTFILALSLSFSAFSQTSVLYYEDFSNGMPADYALYDLDMQVPAITWFVGQPAWIVNPAFAEAAISTSWYTPAGIANDWMVTSAIDVPAAPADPENKFLLVWYGASSNSTYPDGYQVYISTTGNEPADFGMPVLNVPAEAAAGTTRFVDLSAYIGESIYVAFRNNANDGELLIIDDILVGEFSPRGVLASRSRLRGYNPTGETMVRTEFINSGHSNITSLIVNYRIDGGDIVTDSVKVLNVPPFRVFTVTHATLADLTEGVVTIESWVSEINYTENPSPEDSEVGAILSVYDPANTVDRKVLVETYSASSCGPCNPGNANLHSIINALAADDKPVNLKWQQNFPGNGDPYTTDELITRRDYYSINAIPDTRVDGDFWVGNTNSITAVRITGAKSRAGLVEYDLRYWIDETTQTVTVKGSITPLANMLPGTRLMMAIKEKETTANVSTNGETKFLDVVKKLINGLEGIDLGGLTAGEPQNIDVAYTFNGSYRLPANGLAANRINHEIEHSVEQFSDLAVTAWVEFPRDLFVLNAVDATLTSVNTTSPIEITQFSVFPNPATSECMLDVNLVEALPCQISLVNAEGKEVANIFSGTLTEGLNRLPVNINYLSAGSYFVHLRSASGITVRNLEVIK